MLFDIPLTHPKPFMKNRISGLPLRSVLFFFLVIVFLSSCRSNRDLTYLRDAQNSKVVTGSPAPTTEYKIQINDNLYISVISPNVDMNDLYNPAIVGSQRSINNVWQSLQGQYVQGYLVEPDGTVNLPAIGKIPVVGLTLTEAEGKIKAKAQEYLKDVTAKVRLLNFKVTVTGEVVSPGVYYNYNYEFTVFDALASAGGAKNAAKLNKVLVLRRTKTGTQTFTLNLNASSALSSPGYILQPNDVVLVQPARYKNVELRLPIYSAAIATVTATALVLNYLAKED